MSEQASKPEVDYTAMEGPQLLDVLRDDASLWAEAWCQHASKFDFDRDDRGIMITWFANAIEHSSDVRRWRAERAFKGDVQSITPSLK
jgi:hypothetical protein